ncbi:LOW QUALITY PROTEIN: hypothetical protein BU14_0126s0001 [Porphyra umbilicalis]|uniref:Uncharacterized protein n=1 Tax=Porphyra umbilicalis TaxID=2786 RepID=A0A1X6PAQ5_PORUM|nr:LOW QUALITY PROTEIN: hypothetical protein BU14_0126s0001 [Porphyra umbilicalis]|eukprot:OSX77962.1 LOW QUALITY PROTEIN: hypothetical protein BU14_0126s0001 [Porphyra umbilicalis]
MVGSPTSRLTPSTTSAGGVPSTPTATRATPPTPPVAQVDVSAAEVGAHRSELPRRVDGSVEERRARQPQRRLPSTRVSVGAPRSSRPSTDGAPVNATVIVPCTAAGVPLLTGGATTSVTVTPASAATPSALTMLTARDVVGGRSPRSTPARKRRVSAPAAAATSAAYEMVTPPMSPPPPPPGQPAGEVAEALAEVGQRRRRRRHRRPHRRRIDGRRDGLPAQRRPHRRRNFHPHRRPRFRRRRAEVRGGEHPRVRRERRRRGGWVGARGLHRKAVDGGARDGARLEGGEQRRLVDNAPAGRVDHARAAREEAEPPPVDQVAGAVDEWHVEGEKVGRRDRIVERRGGDAVGGGRVGGQRRVRHDNGHAEGGRPCSHLPPNAAIADNGKRLADERHAHKRRPVPAAGLEGRVRRRHVPRERTHERDRVLRGGHPIGHRRVDDEHPRRRGCRQARDVVHARPRTANDLEAGGPRGEQRRVHRRAAAHDERVAVADGRRQLRG